MTIMSIQVAMVCVFGVMLVAGVRLRSNGKSLTVANVVEQFQQALATAPMMTKEQRRAAKKARKNTRKIGWAERRLVHYCLLCKSKTKGAAFRHLNKMAKSANPNDVAKVVAVLERLASGQGDTRYQAPAMELFKQTSPRQALKLQVSLNTMARPDFKPYQKPEIGQAMAEAA